MKLFRFFIAFLLILYVTCETLQDPYKILGLTRKSTQKDIKRAYKALAREWHPDKNEDPDAQEKFVAISKSYELLSDPLKKERYDKFGTFDDSPMPDYHHYGGFDQFFGGSEESFFNKQRVSLKQYMHTILGRSHQQPFLFFAYSNYCHMCFRLLDQWKSVTEDLEPLGYGIGSVNAFTDGNLLEKLRVTQLPQIVAVVEGRVIPFRENAMTITAKKVRVFARDIIPNTYFEKINNHGSLRRFVDTWTATNKVSILIVGAASEPRLRYLLTAMKYSAFAKFGYVHNAANTEEVDSLRNALSIKCKDCENVLIFNDTPENGPVSRLSISNINQLTVESLHSLIETNKFLALPRLSSMDYFDEICPVSSRNPRNLCAILPVFDTEEEKDFVDSWRTYAINSYNRWSQMKLRLVYIYANKQSEWLRPFIEKRGPEQVSPTARDILVIWRTEHVKARFVWLPSIWNGVEDTLNKVFVEILTQRIKLSEECHVSNLKDEFALSWWTRGCRTFVRMIESTWYYLSKEEAYPLLSGVATLVVILLIGYGLNYMNQDVKYRKKVRTYPEDWHPDDPQLHPDAVASRRARYLRYMSPSIHELRAESYFGMIRLLKPGCRSLIVLVDESTKDQLLPIFAEAVYPLRNNKTFSFGYLMVNKNLEWFVSLLKLIIPDGYNETHCVDRLKKIESNRVVGTVLSLCGWKLYYCIYHPMHDTDWDYSESEYFADIFDDYEENNQKTMLRKRMHELASTDPEIVLSEFSSWIDQLLEGTVRRYYIPEWPDNLR
ncbi:unnamed protein product [Auanema sp. JU1783]|nr:unnamed protein product [Auanema sp. JU1783]